MDSGHWTVVSGQRSVDSRQWTVVSGQVVLKLETDNSEYWDVPKTYYDIDVGTANIC